MANYTGEKVHVRIDLTGPQGNALCVLGMVSDRLKKCLPDGSRIAEEYMARATYGNYSHLLAVTKEYANLEHPYGDDEEITDNWEDEWEEDIDGVGKTANTDY